MNNLLKLAFTGLMRRKLRSMLTALGIIIGISVVVALIFLGNGLKGAVTSQLQQFGSNLIFAIPGNIANPFTALLGRGEFRDKDLEAVQETPGVKFVMPIIESRLIKGEFRGEKKTVALHAQPWALIKKIYEESQGFKLRSGEWPQKEKDREIILGGSLAKKTFKNEAGIDDTLTLRGRKFKIVGVLQEMGEQNHDNSVFISLEMFRHITGKSDGFSSMIIKSEEGQNLNELASKISLVLEKQKGLEDFTVLTAENASRIVGNITGVVELILFLIAAVAVIVSGIGIMNTEYTSVLERRREIGIMKALGAKNQQIIMLFLLESGLIGLSGGVIGILGGSALAKYIAYLAQNRGFKFLQIAIDPLTILLILIFTVLIGVLSGILPAKSSAQLKPAEALRL